MNFDFCIHWWQEKIETFGKFRSRCYLNKSFNYFFLSINGNLRQILNPHFFFAYILFIRPFKCVGVFSTLSNFQSLSVFAKTLDVFSIKNPIMDVWQDPTYARDQHDKLATLNHDDNLDGDGP